MRHFEDIEVGETIEVGRHAVSREEIIRFAEQWDPQPFHIDEEAARDSIFGGLSASSCHTYSISSLIFSRSACIWLRISLSAGRAYLPVR